MNMFSYIAEIQRQLVTKYGFVVGENGCPKGVPDGVYPMDIEGKVDHVKITRGKISCCNFKEEK